MTLRALFLLICMLGASLLAELDLAQTKNAKAATVLIEATFGLPLGSGFCVSADGYVLTTHRVVERVKGQVRVVLYPGEPEQRVVEANVFRLDKVTGLALLRLSGDVEALSFLPLGDTATLVDAAPLTTLGCSSAGAPGAGQGSCPAVSVNQSALITRRGTGGSTTYYGFQIAGQLDPCACGGPVLDGQGKVVGVVALGRGAGSDVTQVVSADQARLFVAPPDLVVSPLAEVPWDQRFGTAVLQVQATGVVPVAGTVTCQVSPLPPAANRVPDVHEDVPGQTWTATVPVLDRPAPDSPVNVRIETADATVIGTIPNRSVGFAAENPPQEHRWELRDLAKIVPGKSVEVRGGITLAKGGLQLTGLEPLVVSIAGQSVTVPLAAVKTLQVTPSGPVPRGVRYRVSIFRDGQPCGTTDVAIRLQRPPWEGGAAPQPVPAVDEDDDGAGETGEVKLPAPYTDCVRAGAGRHLLLPMPSVRKLAIFDLREKAITGYVPLVDEDAMVAGGRNSLFVASPTAGLLERWSLDPLKRERRVGMPFSGKLCSVTMGANADGPLFAVHWADDRVVRSFVDGQSLSVMTVTDERSYSYNYDRLPCVRAADCGTVFGVWEAGPTPSRMEIDTLTSRNVLVARSANTGVGHVLPGPNGDWVYTGKGDIYTSFLEQVTTGPSDKRCLIPSSHPAYYLGLAMSQPGLASGGETRVSIFVRGSSTPVLALPPKLVTAADRDTMARSQIPYDKRYHFVPQFQVFAFLPYTDDRIVLRRVDIEQALREHEIDFLFVESIPPAQATRGAAFRYQIGTRTSARSVTYELDSGPEGMAVSPTGELVWNVPDAADDADGIIVSLKTDDGQSLFHVFNLKVVP